MFSLHLEKKIETETNFFILCICEKKLKPPNLARNGNNIYAPNFKIEP